jgi:hypothetical protein
MSSASVYRIRVAAVFPKAMRLPFQRFDHPKQIHRLSAASAGTLGWSPGLSGNGELSLPITLPVGSPLPTPIFVIGDQVIYGVTDDFVDRLKADVAEVREKGCVAAC